MVYVVSKINEPLMPCSNVIARLLLKQGKAKVKHREPFTIKLTYQTAEYTQALVLGVDTGSGTIGTAVADEKNNVVYMSEVIVRNDITDKMEQRAKYRRNRRNRKTRYRKARWRNRANSIKSGRISPTIRSKLHSHVKEIEFIKSILPISTLVIEAGQFDPHLMKNPDLANKPWGYQKGPSYGYENTKAMVLDRDHYICQSCNGKHRDSKLEAHHIIFRRKGGSDEAENLITLCHTCHKKLHEGKVTLHLSGKMKSNLKFATQMNSIRKQLLVLYPTAIETFGYVTKANRYDLKIVKTHYYDASVIATQGNPFAVRSKVLRKKCIADGDFQQTKGTRSEKRITTAKICNFRKFDKVKYLGKEYFIKGRMSSGYAILMDINGKIISFADMPKVGKTPKMSKFRKIGARSPWIVTTEEPIQNLA